MMASYFFPAPLLKSKLEARTVDGPHLALHQRHDPKAPVRIDGPPDEFGQPVLDLFITNYEIEIEVKGAASLEAARQDAEIAKAMMMLHDTSPFPMPVVADALLFDSKVLAFQGRPARERPAVGVDARVWLHEPLLETVTIPERCSIEGAGWSDVNQSFEAWKLLEASSKPLRMAREALCLAPHLPNRGASLLHTWQGLEGLFPGVNQEVSFRLALMLTQLLSVLRVNGAECFDKIKQSYKHRSRVTHAGSKPVTKEQWSLAWQILTGALRAVLERGKLPTDRELLEELLPTP